MSKYGKKADDGSSVDPMACAAAGCPCRASVNVGAGWLCRYHDGAEPDRWRGITDGLREHDWMLGLMDELQHRYAKGEDKHCRELIARFWEPQPDMLPGEKEWKHLPSYLYRLNSDLAFRVGASKRRPVAR